VLHILLKNRNTSFFCRSPHVFTFSLQHVNKKKLLQYDNMISFLRSSLLCTFTGKHHKKVYRERDASRIFLIIQLKAECSNICRLCRTKVRVRNTYHCMCDDIDLATIKRTIIGVQSWRNRKDSIFALLHLREHRCSCIHVGFLKQVG